MGTDRVQARKWEGVGSAKLPPRDPAHADPEWFQRDLDDEYVDPDQPDFDPFPTPRHKEIP